MQIRIDGSEVRHGGTCCGGALDGLQRLEFWWLMSYFNVVAGLDYAALQNDGHDPGFSDQTAFGGAIEYSRQESRLECFNLSARVT